MCNGVDDCGDQSDERNCSNENEIQELNFHCVFKCRNGTCLHDQQLCNRYNDCENGEDENMCNYTVCSNSLKACGSDINSFCTVKPFNYYNCECKSGFQFDESSRTCLGIKFILIELNK